MITEELDWLYSSDINTINLLMSFASEIDDYEENRIGDLEKSYCNFSNAFILARHLNMVKENLNFMQELKISKIEEIVFKPCETPKSEAYFANYLEDGVNEKFEDYLLSDEYLKNKLSDEKKLPEQVKTELKILIKKELAIEFNLFKEIADDYLRYYYKVDEEYHFYPKKSNQPLLTYYDKSNKWIKERNFDIFSINKNIKRLQEISNVELFPFYEVGNKVFFGLFDLQQVIYFFEMFLLSGHFLKVYDETLAQKEEITKVQKKMSQFFAACVADYLQKNNYILPVEKYKNKAVPSFEIDKILNADKRNILKQKGDIDVLAIDDENKKVLIFELKFFKPAITGKDMFYKDKNKIESKKVFEHILERERIVKENIDSVVTFIKGENQKCGEYKDYEVQSILLSARVNYHTLEVDNGIECLSWSRFMKKYKK